MTRRAWSIVAVILGIVVSISLAITIASNSRMSLTGSGLQNGEAHVKTDLPNATCKKVVRLAWPPVRLECEEKEE
jgi:uncharacterized membrane protein YjgN (DUF898 family)